VESDAARGRISLELRRAGFDVVSRELRRYLVPLVDDIDRLPGLGNPSLGAHQESDAAAIAGAEPRQMSCQHGEIAIGRLVTTQSNPASDSSPWMSMAQVCRVQ
jgi:hypothetical protein